MFIKKRTWIQARAYTLVAWMMYLFTFNDFVDNELHRLTLTGNSGVLTFIELLSIGLNLPLAISHFPKMKNKKQFKLGDEVHV